MWDQAMDTNIMDFLENLMSAPDFELPNWTWSIVMPK